jgi:AraC family transcriptional regulator
MMKVIRFGTDCASDPPQKHPEQYATVLARLLEAADDAIENDPMSARNCIGRALALLRPASGQPWKKESAPITRAPCARGGLAPWQIRQVVNHIDANCAENLRGTDLARVAKLSTSYFIRPFKASFGETPHAYVIRRRIMHAQDMMLETDESLGLIAVACGFSDQAHFCRRFRMATGMRPQNWRGARRGKSTGTGRGRPAAALRHGPLASPLT